MDNGRNYYEEIRNVLETIPSESTVRTVNALCTACREYFWYHTIREKMSGAEENLQNYYDQEEFIAQRKYLRLKPRKRFSMRDKLYIEFLQEIHKKYKEMGGRDGFETFMDENISSNNMEEHFTKINECFKAGQETLIRQLQETEKNGLAIDEYNFYMLQKHDFGNIHQAMKEVRKALKTERPPIDASLEAVVTKEMLERIVFLLNSEANISATFVTAPVLRALYDGHYQRHTDKKNNSSVYFNLKSEYNLVEIRNRVNATKNLLKEYNSIMKEIAGYRKQFVD